MKILALIIIIIVGIPLNVYTRRYIYRNSRSKLSRNIWGKCWTMMQRCKWRRCL